MTVNETDSLTPAELVNPKPLVAAIKEFFGSSQLSQFMDQPTLSLSSPTSAASRPMDGSPPASVPAAVRDIHPPLRPSLPD